MIDKKLSMRVFEYAHRYKKPLYLTILLTLGITIIAPLRPYLVEYIIDHAIAKGDNALLLNFTILLVASIVLNGLFQYFQTLNAAILGQSVIKDIRHDVFNNILNLRLKFFDNTPLGILITRTVSDLETIADVFSDGIISIIGDLLQVFAIIAIMLYIDVRLTIIVLLPMPLLFLTTYIFKEAIKTSFTEVRVQITRLNSFLQEHITGMYVTQIFNREQNDYNQFQEINSSHRNAHISSNLAYSIFFPVVELISAASVGLLVWWGTTYAINGEISPGVIVSFMMYISLLYRPIRELADKFNTLQMGLIGAERIFKLMDNPDTAIDNGTLDNKKIKGDIVFKDVWFAYNEEHWVLKNISFSLKEGETLALVGATGAGKSSIINILNRFYEVGKGAITIDDVDILDYKLSSLRSQIITVQQDVFLFSDTIYNNISLKNSEITNEEIERAARAVGADRFIKNLPGGYNYNVQERGATLSTGQAQLIALIRTFIYNPAILILDEATSSVDTETELIIQNAINKLMQNRTTLVVAHRLSTVQNADKIIVLDKGEIVEIGSHQELLRKNGYYKKLYDLQFNSQGVGIQ